MPPVDTTPSQEYICTCCGYIYHEAEGDPENGVPPGTLWAQVPECWKCPWCSVGKNAFDKL